MKKDQFEKLVKPLGSFKRKWGGHPSDEAYQDIVFEPYQTSNLCQACNQGHIIHIERKFSRQNQYYWRWKCTNCKEHWQKEPL